MVATYGLEGHLSSALRSHRNTQRAINNVVRAARVVVVFIPFDLEMAISRAARQLLFTKRLFS